ncbi:response regulator transcription factor [Marinivivus vitaminiproducens]|uniref:response regulator transcription factor n=1 Tax=Marinivivus vitaminiproducens TaxID=3035935 RepID=UPI00279B41F7|nr:response regulator [Geminicoccaceae bacterium SCSIO 64248]
MASDRLISVVDDDASARTAIAALLRTCGFASSLFATADDFLAALDSITTACLIADMQMPGMSGLDLHRRVIASGHRFPTILVTAYPDEASRQAARDAGVQAYLTKPITAETLIACIAAALASSDRNVT